MDLTLNQKLRFEFSDLDLKGTKIESFYKKRFQVFLFKNTRELSVSQKLEAILTQQIEEKSEIEIQDNLSEKTFIQGELIRSEHYLNDITIDDNLREKLNLWIDYLKQIAKHKTKKKTLFSDLFRDKDKAKEIKDIFEKQGYTIGGKWKGLSENKSELLCAYNVLKPLLKPGLKDTPAAKIFYYEFGLPEDYISDRMLTKEPFNDDRAEFEKIFNKLLQPKK